MKVGDQMVVRIDRFDVAMATVEDISDGKATILIPATRVVMGITTQLTELNPEVDRAFGGLVEGKDERPSEAAEAQINESGPPAQPQKEQAAQASDTPFSNAPALTGEQSLRNMNFDTSALDKE